MLEKETSQGKAKAAMDLSALELEIDKEIDDLFVPMRHTAGAEESEEGTVKPDRTSRRKAAVPKQRPSLPANSTPETHENHGAKRTMPGSVEPETDLSTLEPEIDSTIDALFVPVQHSTEAGKSEEGAEKPARTAKRKTAVPKRHPDLPSEAMPEAQEIQAGEKASGGKPDAGTDLGSFELEIDKEIDALFVPAMPNTAGPEAGEEKTSTPQVEAGPEPAASEPEPAVIEVTPEVQEIQVGEKASGGKPDTGTDLGSFELDIDKEIDALFVPAMPNAAGPEAAEEKTSTPRVEAGPKPAASEPEPAVIEVIPEVQEIQVGEKASGGKPDAGTDSGSFELDIDKEIDALFVPTTHHAAAPVDIDEETFMQIEYVPSPADPEVEPDFVPLARTEPGQSADDIDRQIDNILIPSTGRPSGQEPVSAEGTNTSRNTKGAVPARDIPHEGRKTKAAPAKGGPEALVLYTEAAQESTGPKDDELPTTASTTQPASSSEAAELVEQFNAAYLSLDWEVSKENISKFLAVLAKLEPFTSRSADAKSVHKLMGVILKRLLARPHAVNSRLVRLIRDSQGLLAHMVLIGREPGDREKEKLKELFDTFNDLRQRALAAKARKEAARDIPPKAAQIPPEEAKPAAEALPAIGRPPGDTAFLQELRDWMDDVWRSLSEDLGALDSEVARLRQIAAMVGGTSDLSSVARRLNGIGHALESRIDFLKGRKSELIQWVSRIAALETGRAGAEVSATNQAAGRETAAESPESGQVVSHESLCLIESNGKCIALPAFCVLRAAKSKINKGRKILKRGYATLADFSPFLRGAKSGILGEWKNLPKKELAALRFEPVEPAAFERKENQGPTAVLVSDGQHHAVIFADSVDFTSSATLASRSGDADPDVLENGPPLITPAFDPTQPASLPEQLSSGKPSDDGGRRR